MDISETISDAVSEILEKYKIENVPCLTQRDNINKPSTSCFNTSLSMCIQYCLNLLGKDKKDIGCSNESMQLEDYVFEFLNSNETTEWMKKNTKIWGSWIWNYERRTIFPIETFSFNYLMNPLGFKATFTESKSYDEICDFIKENELPCVIGGDFSSVSSVQGHMNCLIGYNKTGMKEFIVNDPYGNALTGYKDINGEGLSYGIKFYIKPGNVFRVVLIEKI